MMSVLSDIVLVPLECSLGSYCALSLCPSVSFLNDGNSLCCWLALGIPAFSRLSFVPSRVPEKTSEEVLPPVPLKQESGHTWVNPLKPSHYRSRIKLDWRSMRDQPLLPSPAASCPP